MIDWKQLQEPKMRIILNITNEDIIRDFAGESPAEIENDFRLFPEIWLETEGVEVEVEREQPKPPSLSYGVYVQGVK